MSDDTPRVKLPELVEGQEMDAATINEALVKLDAFTDLYLLGQFVNTPPASPADGDAYLLGGAPTGVWNGRAYKIASCIDGAWRFYEPFNGLRAFVAGSNAFLVCQDGQWIDGNALISAHEVSIASAATCDLGAAGALFVTITGTTAITSLGAGGDLLRFVRFAGALTLTHNAVSLILPGAASIVTAAGDCAIFASDSGGNWRCRSYNRASGDAVRPLMPALPSFHAYKTAMSGNVTGDGTDFAVICDAEDWDTGGNYDTATGLFTAPAAGKYFFSAAVLLVNAGAGHASGYLRIQTGGGMSGVRAEFVPAVFATAGEGSLTASCALKLNAGETVKPIVTVSGGGRSVGVYGAPLGPVMYTNFQGFLIAG